MRQHSTGIAFLALAAAVTLAGCSLLERLDAVDQPVAPAGRIELPEAGIALTFPADWLIEARPTIDDVGLASVLDAEARTMYVPLVAAAPGHRHDRCLVADLTPAMQARSDPPSLDDLVDELGAMLAVDPRWVGLETALVDLPAGRTGRILRDREGEAGSVSTYLFTRADDWVYLECVAHSTPSEDWRTIAETFEFLPHTDGQARSPSPVQAAVTKLFVGATCTAMDELLAAFGNPDPGECSEFSPALEQAIAAGGLALVDATTEAMPKHAGTARSAAGTPASFPPTAGGMTTFDGFLLTAADGVAARRDVAPDELGAATAVTDIEWARACESWRGWITEMGPG